MLFFCNGKNGVCNCDTICSDCGYFDNSGGEEVHTGAVQISDTNKKDELVIRESEISTIEYAVCCLICGETVETVPYLEMSRPCICDKCKAAVMKVREQYERAEAD